MPQAYAPPSGYRGAMGYDVEPEQEGGFDPIKLLWLVYHYRWMVLCGLILALVTGIGYTLQQTPLYQSSAKVEIATSGARAIQDLEVTSLSNDVRVFETARQKILSHDLARRTVYALGLTENPVFLQPTGGLSPINIVRRATGNIRKLDLGLMSAEAKEALAILVLRESLAANLIRNTSIIDVSFSHPSPDLSAKVVNQVARSFIDQGVDTKGETADLARKLIDEQVVESKKRLEESEQRLVAYAKGAGINISGDTGSLVSSNIGELNSSLSKTIDERLLAERYAAQVDAGATGSLPQVFENEAVQALRSKIAELKGTYQEKRAVFKPGFPEMRRLSGQIRELERQLAADIRSIGVSIKIAYEQLKAKEAGLRAELAKLEAEQLQYQERNIDYTILKREVDSNRAQYDTLVGKLNEVSVGSGLRTSSAFVVDEGQVPTEPFSPRMPLNLAGSFLFFGLLTAGFIYIRELQNNTFSVPEQVEKELKLSLMGIIPHSDEKDFRDKLVDDKSAVSEAYRTLRTSLQFTGVHATVKTLMVTSTEASEGKSTTIYQLGKEFARLGLNVLIIDADLRKPRMHKIFGMDNGIGLSNLLTNVVRSGNIAGMFRQGEVENLTLLSAGTIPPNPTDLLVSEKMGLTLHFCAQKYDLVLVDSAPVLGLADALVLGRQCDGVLLAVSANGVPRKAAKHGVSRLGSAGANMLGAVMTKFAVSSTEYNYAYRYMADNYYAYGGTNSAIEDHSEKDEREPKREDGAGNFAMSLFNRFVGRSG